MTKKTGLIYLKKKFFENVKTKPAKTLEYNMDFGNVVIQVKSIKN